MSYTNIEGSLDQVKSSSQKGTCFNLPFSNAEINSPMIFRDYN